MFLSRLKGCGDKNRCSLLLVIGGKMEYMGLDVGEMMNVMVGIMKGW